MRPAKAVATVGRESFMLGPEDAYRELNRPYLGKDNVFTAAPLARRAVKSAQGVHLLSY